MSSRWTQVLAWACRLVAVCSAGGARLGAVGALWLEEELKVGAGPKLEAESAWRVEGWSALVPMVVIPGQSREERTPVS